MGSSSESLLSSDLSNSCTEREYASSIEEFEGEGLCEVDNEECHFMHDQIQSAAFELISPEQKDSFRGRIGSILLQTLSPEELEASLFEGFGQSLLAHLRGVREDGLDWRVRGQSNS